MNFLPIAAAFAIALIGGVAVGLRPGYPFESLLIGATLAAAMAGLAGSVLQFLPPRGFTPTAVIAGCILGLIVAPMLGWAQVLGFGPVRDPVDLIWPVAIVTALLWGRASGMEAPTMRRRPDLDGPRAR